MNDATDITTVDDSDWELQELDEREAPIWKEILINLISDFIYS